MIKKKIGVLLLTGICIFSIYTKDVFAIVRYSAYEDNINVDKVAKNTIRLKGIDKILNGKTSSAAKYEYNEIGKITLRDYAEGTISYEYNNDGTIKKVTYKLKDGSENVRVSIRHVEENSISEYIYENGRIKREIKKIYNNNDFSGDPQKAYNIRYEYDGNELSKKSYIPAIDSDDRKEYTLYSYKHGAIDRIEEKKNGRIDTITLKYDRDGDITETIQNINGKQIVRRISYINDSDEKFYPIYYVDSVKERKIDLDFFASSYKLIKEMTLSVDGNDTTFKYDYTFGNGEYRNVPIRSELSIELNGKNISKTEFVLNY